MNRSVWMFLSLSLCLLPAFAQEQGTAQALSIAEIAARAQSRNLEILKAERAVAAARDNLEGEPNLMGSRLSVGAAYGGGAAYSAETRSSEGWSGSADLTLPVLPQISLGGKISAGSDGQIEEEVSLSVKPLVPARQTYSEERVYQKALVEFRYLRRQTYLNAEQAALNLLIRDQERLLARQTFELEERKYVLAQRRQERGEASFQDVQDQLVNLTTARQALFASEQRFLTDWKTLQLLIAPSETEITVEDVTLDQLLALVKTRDARIARLEEAASSSAKLDSLRLELTALEAELKATPAWRPELSISGRAGLPDLWYSAGLNLAFSPNQLKGDRREELQRDIEVKRLEIAAELYSLRLQRRLLGQSIAIAGQAFESARIQKERDTLSLREAELLYQQGRRTSLELEQVGLNLKRAQIQCFRAAADLYRVQGDLLMLFVSAERD